MIIFIVIIIIIKMRITIIVTVQISETSRSFRHQDRQTNQPTTDGRS